MDTNNITETVCSQLYEYGLSARFVSINRMSEVQREIEGLHTQGLFDADFYSEALSGFSCAPPANLPHAQSVIILAASASQAKVTFTLRGQTRTIVLPPIMVHFKKTFQYLEKTLTKLISTYGFHCTKAMIPHKIVAVNSGLAQYGRNNICYIPHKGSFFQTAAFYTDIPCIDDIWQTPKVMDRCWDCQICIKKCPTHAITSDRFVLKSERCLVFHNERSKKHAFPAWIDRSWHNCLVGCILCQKYCPENKPFIDQFENNEEFSDIETALLLQGVDFQQLPSETQTKLENLDLMEYFSIIPRNLQVFFS